MEITFLGHSSFKIKTKTSLLITDPFDPKMVGFKFPKIKADIVTVSHNHNDHNFVEAIESVRKAITGPGEYEIDEISIIGISSFHDKKKGEERGKNTIYVIEAEGLRLAHLGDLGHLLSEEQINIIGDLDILMLPIGGKFTIGYQEAVEIVHAIEPKIIVPMHYFMPGLNKETFSQLDKAENFLSALGLRVEKLPTLKVKEGSMPAEDQYVALLEKN